VNTTDTPFADAGLIDALLLPWQAAVGPALPAYRNHCQRLFHLTCAFRQHSTVEEDRLIAVAAAFHDIGIWTHHTLDYLEPSAELAVAWLESQGEGASNSIVWAMVVEHHKIRAASASLDLVEAFRRADWTDVMQGHLRFGLAKPVYRQLKQQYPFLGFHTMLLRLGARQLRHHPLQPLPMLRW